MSLVHTCELNGVNTFTYLTTILRQKPEELQANAASWMPWNFTERLKALENQSADEVKTT